jgi:hypothetical protein
MTRNLAARLCSIAASSAGPYSSAAYPNIDGPPSHQLAWDAWDEAAMRTRDDNRRTHFQIWAEAEALLRTGWKP